MCLKADRKIGVISQSNSGGDVAEKYPYIAFDLPESVDPDAWARALLEQIDRDIANGRRTDVPRVWISSESVNGPKFPPQVIAEEDAYRTVVEFDPRHFD